MGDGDAGCRQVGEVVRGKVAIPRGIAAGLGVGFGVAAFATAMTLAIVMAGPSPRAAYAVPATIAVLMIVLLAAARRQWRQWERLTLDARGIQFARWRTTVFLEWGDVALITARFPGAGQQGRSSIAVRTTEGAVHLLRIGLYENREALLRAFKRWATRAYALDAAEERWVSRFTVTGTRVMRLERARGTNPEEIANYRRSPRRHGIEPIEPLSALRGPWFTRPLRRCLAFVGAGALGALPMLVLDQPSGDVGRLLWLLWFGATGFLILTGALFILPVLAFGVWSIHELWRWRSFLGERTRNQHGSFTSLDGRRRYRRLERDVFDPFAGWHEHFEELDADGLTTRSYRTGELRVEREPLETRRAWVARVTPPDDFESRCFEGKPWKRSKPLPAPVVLLLTDTEEGFFLTRFSDDRRYAGDTFHETLAHAREQALVELGLETIEWTELEGPRHGWSFWPEQAA